MTTQAYRMQGIVQRYGGREVLCVPELEVSERSILGLYGPNGSGKSTLMRIMAFLEVPAEGCMEFFGQPCAREANGFRREVTLMTQDPYLLKRTVAANVAYGLKVRGKGMDEDAVRWALEMVGLDPGAFLRRQWFELSGGEAQRVALAARLVLRPRVLLLDEPTASLDEESAVRIREAGLASREQWGATLVVVSHDMAWLRSVADEVRFMRKGRFVEEERAMAPLAAV